MLAGRWCQNSSVIVATAGSTRATQVRTTGVGTVVTEAPSFDASRSFLPAAALQAAPERAVGRRGAPRPGTDSDGGDDHDAAVRPDGLHPVVPWLRPSRYHAPEGVGDAVPHRGEASLRVDGVSFLRRSGVPTNAEGRDPQAAPTVGTPPVSFLRRTRSARSNSPGGLKARTQERGRARDQKYASTHPTEDEPVEAETEEQQEEQLSAKQIQSQALQEFGAQSTKAGFANTSRPPKFDERHWRCFARFLDKKDNPVGGLQECTSEEAVRMRKGAAEIELVYELAVETQPSEAVQAIFDEPKRWALDCIDYVVAARLYAEMRVIGAENFDAKYTSLGTELAPEKMRMDQHQTPGLSTHKFWEREDKAEEFEETESPGDGPSKGESESSDDEPTMTGVRLDSIEEEDAFLAKVPVGTRVMWSTTNALAGGDWVNENTLKAGPDAFIAHPHGILTAEQVRLEMVPEEISARGEDAIREDIEKNVFVAEIEWYTFPRL